MENKEREVVEMLYRVITNLESLKTQDGITPGERRTLAAIQENLVNLASAEESSDKEKPSQTRAASNCPHRYEAATRI